MKEVTRYQADDGKVFDTADKAIAHDAKVLSIKSAYKLLKDTPKNDGCDFANGGGYVQQDPVKVQEFKRQIMLMGATHHAKMAEWARNPQEVHPQSIVGRILSDCDSLLYSAWNRVMCMDDKFREWGQPYYAINPHKGEQKEAA